MLRKCRGVEYPEHRVAFITPDDMSNRHLVGLIDRRLSIRSTITRCIDGQHFILVPNDSYLETIRGGREAAILQAIEGEWVTERRDIMPIEFMPIARIYLPAGHPVEYRERLLYALEDRNYHPCGIMAGDDEIMSLPYGQWIQEAAIQLRTKLRTDYDFRDNNLTVLARGIDHANVAQSFVSFIENGLIPAVDGVVSIGETGIEGPELVKRI